MQEIPFKAGQPQSFTIALNGIAYKITVKWNDSALGGWVIDMDDGQSGAPIIHGIPLITGANLLDQHATLGIPGALYVVTDFNRDAVPTWDNLGINAHLLYDPPA